MNYSEEVRIVFSRRVTSLLIHLPSREAVRTYARTGITTNHHVSPSSCLKVFLQGSVCWAPPWYSPQEHQDEQGSPGWTQASGVLARKQSGKTTNPVPTREG